MNQLQKYILKKIAKKLVKQGHTHKSNIIQYYDIIEEAARNEFIEDSGIGLDNFLKDCFNISLSNFEPYVKIEDIEKSNKITARKFQWN